MLTKSDIEKYLHEMDIELSKKDLTGEIVICGGAVMAYVYEARPSTKDIDALFEPSDELRKIAETIANRHNLEDDWFNDAAKGYIDTSKMNFETVLELDSLLIKRPDDKGMLAMKLASAREDSKDADDAVFLIRKLGINDENELLDLLEENIPSQRLTPMASFFAKEMLNRAINY